ncbi:MAG: phytoene desaturase [Actinobacteria bacterium 13_2_20CM_2_72_6]|nr:MAG: phytoene desaturase [Actinobacteria bacterium 13_2_20CM_2_72_6]
MSRVVVVGAGVGGLSVAARLATAGHRVTVFEQAGVVGGKLGRYERTTAAGTFRFDTGPGLLTLPQVFADLDLDLVPLDPIVRHVFPDGTRLDSGDGFADRIGAALGARSAADWRRLWRRAERVWAASWRDVLTSTVDGPGDLLRLAWHVRDLAAIAPGRSLRSVSRRFADPRLRMLLDRYATYAGADPRRAPAALVAIPYAELAFGGWYLRGGLATLADALLSRCTDVHTGTSVERIETAGGAVTGVRLAGGRTVPADLVVANADALAVYRDLLPAPRRAAALAERSLAGFVLLLGVRGRTAGLAHHTVFFPPDYDAEFDAIFRAGVPAADPTVLVTVADDPAVRPDGYEAWFVLVNAPPQGPVDWTAPGYADAYADRVLATLARRGMDVRDRVLFREVRTPADLAAATGTPGGAIYGTAAHRLLRPPNAGPVRGLYLVGGSVHPGGGLPMVALSARIVAERIGPALRS